MNPEADVRDLLYRGAQFHALAAGLAYPDAELRSRLLGELARLPARAERVAAPFEDLAPAWATTTGAALREEYSRLFIGTDAIAPRECAFTATDRCAVLADLGGFYLAFGFELRSDPRETPDHLAVELEYYSLMLLRQAYALQQGWPEQHRIARDAAAGFLADHLGRWTRALDRQVAERRPVPAYRVLFESIDDGVQRECRTLGVRPAPLEVRGPDPMQRENFVCPMEQRHQAGDAEASAAGCSTRP